jgi:hypothetical protein
VDLATINAKARAGERGSVGMDIEVLKKALNDPKVSEQATESARSAAVSARQESRETINRMDERVQLEVAKAVGTTVELGEPVAAPKKD